MKTFECPKCGADISETLQHEDPDTGIIAGYYCEVCDEGFPYEPETFDDDVHVYIDRSDVLTPQVDRCPKHPELVPAMGYGLAGGGIGVYSYCSECGTVLSKTQDHS